MLNHKQKEIKVEVPTENGWVTEQVEVDKELAPLLQRMNDTGYTTFLSCQDNIENQAWICFDYETGHALMESALYRWVATGYPENDLWIYLSSPKAKWTITYDEVCDVIDDDHVEGTGKLDISQHLRFPKEDIKLLEKLFDDFLNKS